MFLKKEYRRFYPTISKLGIIYGITSLPNVQNGERLKGMTNRVQYLIGFLGDSQVFKHFINTIHQITMFLIQNN